MNNQGNQGKEKPHYRHATEISSNGKIKKLSYTNCKKMSQNWCQFRSIIRKLAENLLYLKKSIHN